MTPVQAALRWLELPKCPEEQEPWYEATVFLYKHLNLSPEDSLLEPVALILASSIKANPPLLFDDIADYEASIGRPVNDTFRLGWEMARLPVGGNNAT